MDGGLAAGDAFDPLVGDPGDHLVRVHVRRGAAAGLEDVQDELIVLMTVGDGLRADQDDGLAEAREEAASRIHVDLRAALIRPIALQEGAREAERADLEVLDRAAIWAP